MFFGRRLQTKLPCIFGSNETNEQKKTRDLHDQKKPKEKYYFDKQRMAKPKENHVGDKVLARQKKCTSKPPFNPEPFTITNTIGNQVHAIKRVEQLKSQQEAEHVIPG